MRRSRSTYIFKLSIYAHYFFRFNKITVEEYSTVLGLGKKP